MTAPLPSGSFIMVDPAHVAEVGCNAAVVFARISWRCERGPWRATYAVLAEETGLTVKAVRGACEVLRRAGWVTSERSSAEDATLVWRPETRPLTCEMPERADQMPHRADPLPERADPPAPEGISSYETGRDLLPPSLPPSGNENDEEQAMLPVLASVITLPAAAVDPLLDEFDGFWGVYPRRVGKAAALRAYRAARKRASMEEIAAGLRAQLPELSSREKRYVPHPATWLNGNRWSDDPRDAAQPAGRRNHYLDRMRADAAGAPAPEFDDTTRLALTMLGGQQ